MILQMMITLAITIAETYLAGFSVITLFSIIARLMFVAKFQGFRTTPIAIMVVEGCGLVLYILITSFFKTFVLLDFIIYSVASLIFIVQVLFEENMKVMVDVRESELEEFMERTNNNKD